MNSAQSPSGILETAIYSDDLEAASEFYGTLLGLEEVMRAGNRHLFYRCGQGMLLIFNPEETLSVSTTGIPVPPHGASGPGHVCFTASNDEIEAYRERFIKAGVEIEMDFHWPNGARSLYVRDPADNSVEFAEPKLWGFQQSPEGVEQGACS